MPRALLLSPHCGDIAFSCAATARHLLRGGWDVQLITIFSGSLENTHGWAPNAEDDKFCEIIGIEDYAHWPLRAAPHRGYESAPDLLNGIREGDEVWRDIAEKLSEIETPDTVFAPQGLGNHVDHLQVIRAVRARGWDKQAFWYRDMPSAMRQPDAKSSDLLPGSLSGGFVVFDDESLQLKIAGCCAYASQIGFQFGDLDGVAAQLTQFHRAEAQAVEREPFAERFVVATEF